MKTLGFGYFRDGGRIFWKDQVVKGVDADSFTILNETWSRDSKHVYVVGRRLKNADPSTFHVQDEVFAKDARTVWTLAGPLLEANASSFETLGSGFVQGYGRDAQNVFHYVRTIGRPRKLREANPGKFAGHFGARMVQLHSVISLAFSEGAAPAKG